LKHDGDVRREGFSTHLINLRSWRPVQVKLTFQLKRSFQIKRAFQVNQIGEEEENVGMTH
jgi:hypothetical protein